MTSSSQSFDPVTHSAGDEDDVEAGNRAPRVGRGSVMTSARSKSWATADAELKRRASVATDASAGPSGRANSSSGRGSAKSVPGETGVIKSPNKTNEWQRGFFERITCKRTMPATEWLAERGGTGPWKQTDEVVVVARSPYAFYQDAHRWSYCPGDPVPEMLGDSIDATTWAVFLAALESTDSLFTRRRNALAVLPAFLQLLGVLACLFLLLLPGAHFNSTNAAIVLLLSILVSTFTHYLGLGDEVWAHRFGFDVVLQSFLAQWQTRLDPLELKVHALPASRRSHRTVWFCSLALPPKPLDVGDYVVVMQGDAQFKAGTSGRIVGFNHKGKAVIKADDKGFACPPDMLKRIPPPLNAPPINEMIASIPAHARASIGGSLAYTPAVPPTLGLGPGESYANAPDTAINSSSSPNQPRNSQQAPYRSFGAHGASALEPAGNRKQKQASVKFSDEPEESSRSTSSSSCSSNLHDQQRLSNAKWQCIPCTFENEASAEECVQCETPRGHARPSVKALSFHAPPPSSPSPYNEYTASPAADSGQAVPMAIATDEFKESGNKSEGLSGIQDIDEGDGNQSTHVGGSAAASVGAASGSNASSTVAWVCTTCTFQNTEARDACKVCGVPQPLETVVNVSVDMSRRASSGHNNAIAVDALTPLSSIPQTSSALGTAM